MRLQATLESIEKLDAEQIKTFVKVLESQGVSNIRLCKYVSHLKLASIHMKVPFKEAKSKDIGIFCVD
jgi:hypothetical protein